MPEKKTCLNSLAEQKNVLFITTKNIDYIRNSQEVTILQGIAQKLDVLKSDRRSYPARLAELYVKLFLMSFQQYDTIFVGFAPQLIIPLFFWKFRKQVVICDFFISVYDTMVNDRKKVKKGSLPAKVIHWIDDVTIRHSQWIIADTKAHGNYFCREFGASENRTEIIYLEADTSIYYPRQAVKPEKWRDKYIVLYFGSILPLQGVDVVMDAACLCEGLEDRIQFVFIGPVNKRYKKIERKYITYIDWLSQEELAEYIAFSDLCLAGHFNGEIDKAKRTIPGKAYIYEAMKKPMILGDSPANHERYAQGQEGICFVKMGDPKELAEMIREHARK